MHVVTEDCIRILKGAGHQISKKVNQYYLLIDKNSTRYMFFNATFQCFGGHKQKEKDFPLYRVDSVTCILSKHSTHTTEVAWPKQFGLIDSLWGRRRGWNVKGNYSKNHVSTIHTVFMTFNLKNVWNMLTSFIELELLIQFESTYTLTTPSKCASNEITNLNKAQRSKSEVTLLLLLQKKGIQL